jgi:DNA polymerase-1
MTEPIPVGSLYLLDTHGLIYQMYFGVGPMTAPDGRPTNAVFGVTRSLLNLYDLGADYLIATLDHDGPTFRSAIDPNYKSHRDPPPDDLLQQEPLIRRVMEAMRIPILSVPGYEADDIMATIATAAEDRGLEVYLCTADKDCRQLISDRVKVLNLRKEGEILDAAGVEKDWGVRPHQVADFQALVGDSVDNIPGVSGVGPKTAAKWLRELGSLNAIMADPDRVSGSAKIKQTLREAIANGTLARSRQLTTLDRAVPLTFDWEAWRRKDWDAQKLLELFQELGFRQLAGRVRKTLASHGRQKNTQLLGILGGTAHGDSPAVPPDHTPGPRAAVRPADAPPKRRSLFEPTEDQDTAAETKEPVPGTGDRKADNWSYAGYELVDTPQKFKSFLTKLDKQPGFVFDLETTGLDPLRCEIVGYAFCWEAGTAHYLPVRAPENDARLDPDGTLAALKPVFENPRIWKRNHNVKFDQIVLAAHGVSLAGVAGDSMIAHFLLHPGARGHGLDELTREILGHENIKITDLIGKGKKQLTLDLVPTARVRDYAAEDADTAYRLSHILEPRLANAGLQGLYQEVEIPLLRVLARMEFTGIRIDVPFLQKLAADMTSEIAVLERQIYDHVGREFNIASLRELQKILYEELKLPVQRRTGVKNEPSTDQESLERLAALGHPLPRLLLAYRKVTKLKNTYVDVLPAIVNPRTGRVHTSFNQTAVETGRLSSSDPNLQNIPARTEQGAQLRRAFIPEDGWVLLTADYSQIELRLLAHFCGDETLRRAFTEGRDVHTAVAAEIFKVNEAEVTKMQRAMAKTVNFGVIYGMSAAGLSARLSIPRPEAEAFIDQYFSRYPRVWEYQQALLRKAHSTGVVTTLLGHRRQFAPEAINPDSHYRSRSPAEREAINMEIQGSAADLLKRAMLAVSNALEERAMRSRMLLTVHDELVFEAPPDEVQPLAELVRAEMGGALKLEVPLVVDVAAGPNWLDVVEL